MSQTDIIVPQQVENMSAKQNYRPREAAEYLSCGLSSIWLYIKQSKLKAYKLSDRVTIIKKEDLDNFINAGAA